MSIIIKSNNVYSGSHALPSIEQVTTSESEVYNTYAARVAADGGTIVSISKVKEAISFLFKNSLVGRMGLCASPHYAKKLTPEGGIMKLYSIVGADLVPKILTSGEAPKITVDNFVNFGNGAVQSSTGGILTTSSSKDWLKSGRFSVSIAQKDIKNTSPQPIFDFTSHGDSGMGVDLFAIQGATAAPLGISSRIANGIYGRSGDFSYINNSDISKSVTLHYDETTKKGSMIRKGTNYIHSADITIPSPAYTDTFYADFGGANRAAGIGTVSGVKVSAMWIATDANLDQAKRINEFFDTEYL